MHRKLIALAALAVAVSAISGIGYAAIPSANGVISACKDSKGALKVIDAEAGQTCNSNQQLLAWNQQGPQGPPGQNGVSGREIKYATSSPYNSNAEKYAIAECSQGKVVVGGGGGVGMYSGNSYLSPDGVAINISKPENSAWIVVAREMVPTDQDWEVTAWAICVNAS